MCQSIWMNHLSWTYHEEYVFQKTADGDDRPQFFVITGALSARPAQDHL